MCYVIRTLGVEKLMTMNDQIMILGIDPKLDCPFLGQIPKFLAID